jgi:hypothetical protein
MQDFIAGLDQVALERELDEEGGAILPGLLDEHQVRQLAAPGNEAAPLVAHLRASFRAHLAALANRWNARLGVALRYPDTLDACLDRSGDGASLHVSRLREGEYQPLHRRDEGDAAFPLQLVALLGEPGVDFTGGEFVMTEQRPRMQSRPLVLPLRKGDMAVIAVGRRPCRGANGWYGVNMKHAVSRVRSGERVGLEILLGAAQAVDHRGQAPRA